MPINYQITTLCTKVLLTQRERSGDGVRKGVRIRYHCVCHWFLNSIRSTLVSFAHHWDFNSWYVLVTKRTAKQITGVDWATVQDEWSEIRSSLIYMFMIETDSSGHRTLTFTWVPLNLIISALEAITRVLTHSVTSFVWPGNLPRSRFQLPGGSGPWRRRAHHNSIMQGGIPPTQWCQYLSYNHGRSRTWYYTLPSVYPRPRFAKAEGYYSATGHRILRLPRITARWLIPSTARWTGGRWYRECSPCIQPWKIRPESQPRMYVQDILWADRVEVVHLWNQGAKVYVCGGINMTDGVKNSPRS
jgi:hypothetical protein